MYEYMMGVVPEASVDWAPSPPSRAIRPHPSLTERVFKLVWLNSIPAQIRQLILYISENKG